MNTFGIIRNLLLLALLLASGCQSTQVNIGITHIWQQPDHETQAQLNITLR